ncbi:enamine deaminase RidA [Paucibacter sp. KBW04]|uniref:RidA family protein n=1 Tax=Paucibacter sp. KBW04 TaxID=2153361 RepID=UPI000F5735B2|nr:RidA family protein [Paucibacter sp. KBW04]RQO54458.1 enamine deaminase RidA [Paucibacter sp. KBW04]
MTTSSSNSSSLPSSKQILQPAGWAAPRGYANGVAATGRQVFVAGQIGWNAACQFESEDFIAQVRQTLLNIKAVLAEAGAEPKHMTRMTWYLTDKREYLARGREVGAVYREVLGSEYQIAMTAVQVVALMEDQAKVEIEVTAVVPE